MPGDKDTRKLGHSLTPELGEYNSGDTGVAELHLRWASQYGINLLQVSWAGPGKRDPSLDNDEIDLALKEGLLRAPSIAKVKFLLVYETEKALKSGAERSRNERSESSGCPYTVLTSGLRAGALNLRRNMVCYLNGLAIRPFASLKGRLRRIK